MKTWHSSHPAYRSLPALATGILIAAPQLLGELIYTENFNTDGDGTRYTTRGKGLVLLDIEGNKEPSYWTHSSKVIEAGELVGVVVPAAGRRAVIMFQSGVAEASLTPEALKLIENTANWLTDGKKGKVLFSPSSFGEGDQAIAGRLTTAGYTVADDDTTAALPDATSVALAISTSGALPAPTRFTRYGAPFLSYNGPNHDDELTSSIGSTITFDPGDITIADPAHPIAAGLPAKFKFVTQEVGLDTVGVTLPAKAKVIATYKFTNPDTQVEEVRPLLAVVEKGDNLLGGAFSGAEGAGYWAGADMNEPSVTPDCCNTETDPRQLTLNPVNVSGKSDLRLTVALAATDIDFESNDFIRILVDPDGDGPAEFTQLVNFTVPTAADKFFVDSNGTNRLGSVFRDAEYKLPANATQLVVRFESFSTFFNEIVAFDNVRIHSGPLTVISEPIKTTVGRDPAKPGNVLVSWTGGSGSYILESTSALGTAWTTVKPTTNKSESVAAGTGTTFFRVRNAQ